MGLILDVAMRNLTEDHPQIDLRRCVNGNQKRLECRACMKICPKHVYDPAQKTPPKWDECQNCGLCVSACPTRCIAPSAVNVKRHMLLSESAGSLMISCTRSAVSVGHKEACLALLPWEFLGDLALAGRLSLDLSPCENCPHADCKALLAKQLEQLRRFLGEERYAAHVDERPDIRQEDVQSGVNRRDFFKSIVRSGKKTTALVVQEAGGESADGFVYRRRLVKRVKDFSEEQNGFSMLLPWFSEKCHGCGLCMTLCPNQAIEISGEQDGKRGIIVNPQRCTGCGVCQAICLDGGVEEICAVRLKTLDRALMARVNSSSCAECGRAVPPGQSDGLCIACRLRRKKRR